MTRKSRKANGSSADPIADGTASAAGGSAQPVIEPSATRTCPWCSAEAPDEATTCPSCHAALASRVEEDGPGIPGLTAIDPELLAYRPTPRKPQRIVDSLIKLLDEEEPDALARLYPEPEEGQEEPATETMPPTGDA
jgi:cytochrome c553